MTSTVDLRHDFFATRMVACSRSNDAGYYLQASFDTRITCSMLLVACSACDPATAEQLAPTDSQQIPPSHPLGGNKPDPTIDPLYLILQMDSPNDLPPLSSQSVLKRFPMGAFFFLATGLIRVEPYS
ncbi:hypothetical protein EYZ11_009238 [Aspergillus tanneri]|uniref:Uncharacterized protein n=1 Tax=Aspergillus tanneri TaxID=1220188 RepID=A0A4S3JAI6_9EURO|nr:uncharacterized protein ATNIH1004_000077 [Aspergillus tanneri]KAA8651199.1 hypothetical protein ATNIH1004_000077 [Aspergillus tanneri]THC91288.1 hypothetical protein EYZ11_009238 [Aspergillus tanneri]